MITSFYMVDNVAQISDAASDAPSCLESASHWVMEDFCQRNAVSNIGRRREQRPPRFIKELANLRLSLPSVSPPPPPPPDYLLDSEIDPMDVDMEGKPYHYCLNRDSSGRRKRRSLLASKRDALVAISALVFLLLALGLLLTMLRRRPMLEFLAKLA